VQLAQVPGEEEEEEEEGEEVMVVVVVEEEEEEEEEIFKEVMMSCIECHFTTRSSTRL
jgi:hypothetical protein